MSVTKNITLRLAGERQYQTAEGTSLQHVAAAFAPEYTFDIIAAKVNGEIRELSYIPQDGDRVVFLDLSSEDGMRIYRRSLYFLLIRSAQDLFPGCKLVISHAISKGLYCEFPGHEISEEDLLKLEARMRERVRQNIPFVKRTVSKDEALALFQGTDRMDRYRAIAHRSKTYVTLYDCDGYDDYFYGYMAPDTGYIHTFALQHYHPGFVLRFPERKNPQVLPDFFEQKKLYAIFKEYKRWNKILGVESVGAMNDIVRQGGVNDFIRVAEALHEKKIASIADMICGSSSQKRLVTIAGPSSSGKTTFANRLAIQLRVNGLKPVTISLDDYFLNRDMTPMDEDGEYDFESIDAIDVPLFNEHLAALIRGEEVEIPRYNFHTGSREASGVKKRIQPDDILVVEGIHGLNEKLTASIPREQKFKIYVSALTAISIDDHNRISTTDSRVIRRMVRDYQFRGTGAVGTLSRWASVRRGEEKNIFPFQEEADVMFNSSLFYELSALKVMAEPLLAAIQPTEPVYSEARRLLEFLSYFLPVESKEVPLNSILREFVGGSCFYT